MIKNTGKKTYRIRGARTVKVKGLGQNLGARKKRRIAYGSAKRPEMKQQAERVEQSRHTLNRGVGQKD